MKYQNSIIIQNGRNIVIDGEAINIPDHVKNEHNHRSSIVNGKIYVNGNELMGDGTFKKTLRSLYHKWF